MFGFKCLCSCQDFLPPSSPSSRKRLLVSVWLFISQPPTWVERPSPGPGADPHWTAREASTPEIWGPGDAPSSPEKLIKMTNEVPVAGERR